MMYQLSYRLWTDDLELLNSFYNLKEYLIYFSNNALDLIYELYSPL